MSENNYSDKSFDLTSMTITSATGEEAQVVNLLAELTIIENMKYNTVSGQVILSESFDIIKNLNMQGFEKLSIIFGKPGGDSEERVFRIYKVGSLDHNKINQSSQTYVLHFASDELIKSATIRISKSYKGKMLSDIVSDILENFLEVDSEHLNVEDSKNTHNYIIPGWTPFQTIKWCQERTLDDYLFYESLRGYNFRKTESVFGQAPVASYSFRPQNISTNDELNPNGERTIISYDFPKVFDSLNGIQYGLYSSSLRTIDLLRQKVDLIEFNYKDEFKKLPHIESDAAPLVDNDDIGKKVDSFRRYYTTTKEHDSNKNISKQPGIRPNMIEKWMLGTISVNESLSFFSMNLLVPGDTSIALGDIIEVKVPSMIPGDEGDENTLYNKKYSGRFLVTGIRHMINPIQYTMTLEVTKDSYAKN